ncbi:MAG: Gldg family protein [Clostridia bacterium]|nr:Gldg family protein [Clostridia bacterium]
MKNKSIIRTVSHRCLGTVLVALAILAVIALNLVLTYFGGVGLWLADMTPEGLYTVSDDMKKYTSFINELDNDERKIKITFCSDPDILVASENTRVPYFLALGLQNIYDRVEVETVNVEYNPTAVSQYKATSLSTIEGGDIIVSYGDRYRVVNARSFWLNDGGGNLYSFNGEYKLTSIIMSVVAKNRPVAYFVTNHGETYYDAQNPSREGNAEAEAIYNLLTERGLTTKTLDLSAVSDVPDDCVLLVINNPRTDFLYDESQLDTLGYVSETEKLDRYLVSNQGAIMISKDYKLDLPTFEGFLYEWGFDIADAVVIDEENSLSSDGEYSTKIIGEYDTDENGYGMAIYESFATLATAPVMAFSDTAYLTSSYGPSESVGEPGTKIADRNYAPFFFSSDKAYAKAYENGALGGLVHDASVIGKMDLSAVTTRLEIDQRTAEYKYSYVFCTPSADAFSNEILGNSSYANFDVMSALVENISRIDEYASIDLGGTSFNSSSTGGKPLINSTMSSLPTYEYSDITGQDEIILNAFTETTKGIFTAFIAVSPVVVLIIGIAVRIKRKYM